MFSSWGLLFNRICAVKGSLIGCIAFYTAYTQNWVSRQISKSVESINESFIYMHHRVLTNDSTRIDHVIDE
jgi:hypothetical protein